MVWRSMKLHEITQDGRVVVELSQGEIHELVEGKKFYSGELPGPNTGRVFHGVKDGKILMGELELTPEEFDEYYPRLSAERLGTRPV